MVGDGFLRREEMLLQTFFPSSIAHFEYMFLQSQLHHTVLLLSLVQVTRCVSIGTDSRIAIDEVSDLMRGHSSGVAVAGLHSFHAFFAIEGCMKRKR
jgi:hypothetical protein